MPGRALGLKQLSALYPQADLWLHNAWFVDMNDQRVGHLGPPFGTKRRLVPSIDAIAVLLVQNTIALPAAMFRLELALKTGGLDETLWYTADWDLWLRLARQGPVAWFPDYLAFFRIHPDSLTLKGSTDLNDFRKQLITVRDRYLGALTEQYAASTKALADASINLNVCLAGTYHGERVAWAETIVRISRLGPVGIWQFFYLTQIFQRIMCRLKARMKK